MADNPRSIIVVGAGPGLGGAIAARFGAEGFRVGLVSRHESVIAPALMAAGIDVHTAVGDAGYTGSLHDALDRLTATLGVPDVLVYNAALPIPGRPSTLDSVQLLASLATNVGGFVDAVQRVVQSMRVRRSGTILASGCGIALQPWVDAAGLSVGKAALRTMVHALVTIKGIMSPRTALAPERVAEEFWRVYAQPRAEWRWEQVFDPAPED
jgi:NADP-dependent 3-hydroxy acid dehydrogenase YdfG